LRPPDVDAREGHAAMAGGCDGNVRATHRV
jgi:hypothetical protein